MSWSDLVEDVRILIRGKLDDATLASLRMTCKEEERAQLVWFQLLPIIPGCSWTSSDDGLELIIVRPRRRFVECALTQEYYGLVQWALNDAKYKDLPTLGPLLEMSVGWMEQQIQQRQHSKSRLKNETIIDSKAENFWDE